MNEATLVALAVIFDWTPHRESDGAHADRW